MRTIAVAHHKGGTAKTTTTVNLAAALAERGLRVLVIDMDPQSSASSWLGVRDAEQTVIEAIRGRRPLAHLVYETSAPGVQLVPASPGLVVSGAQEETDTALGFIKAMEDLPPLWDFVLVDCPPSLGYLGVAPLAVCQEVLVPVEAHALAVAGLAGLMLTIDRAATRLNPKLRIAGLVACRVNHTIHSRTVVERLAKQFPKSFMRTQIRENVRLAEAPSFRLPITTYAPQSTAAKDYRDLAAEVTGEIAGSPSATRSTPRWRGSNGATVPPTVSVPAPPPIRPAAGSPWARIAGASIAGRGWAEIFGPLLLLAILAIAAFVRTWQLNAIGFNTDEAVYSGQAASLANDPNFTPFFPIFRAHPLLFQFALAGLFTFTGVSDANARLLAATLGVLTVYLVYRLGRLLYNRDVGLVAALFLAVMPYHVVITRQVLLDGPMTLFSALALYAMAQYAMTGARTWLYGTGAAMGLTFLAKETGVILLGSIFAFFALAPSIRIRIRDLVLSVVLFLVVVAAFPLALVLAGAGGSSTAQQYLVWQLFRLPNHDMAFYLQAVPAAVGPLMMLVAAAGLIVLRRRLDWREGLLLTWIVVVVAFFELWPTKGFQYLLPAAPPLTVLAGRGTLALSHLHLPLRLRDLGHRIAVGVGRGRSRSGAVLERGHVRKASHPLRLALGTATRTSVLAGAVAASVIGATWSQVQPSRATALLAGTGGMPGGREAGTWIRDNTPVGAELMTIGPSMANVIQFYGRRKAYGLSVSPNPLKRNPSYDPLINPDLQIRNNTVQYVVWDSYSAARSTYFGARLLDYAARYHGHIIHIESLPAISGGPNVPVIVVYEVGR